MSDDASTNQTPGQNPEGNQPEIDPRFVDDPRTKSGKPRARRKNLTAEEQEKLTEEIRMSLILDVNEGDIKRDVWKRWNLKPKRTQKYITRARRRNASSLAESPEDALASSIGYWGRLKRNAEARLQREEKIEGWANAALDRCEKDADALRERATKETPLTEQFEAIEMRRSNAIALREQARRAQFAASTSSKEAQREIDRLKGNHAPLKIAKTDSKGNDVAAIRPEDRQERLRLMGFEPVIQMPKVIQVDAIDVTPAAEPITMPPVNGTNGHVVSGRATNGHAANGHTANGYGTNGHANNSHSEPPAGGDDDLQ